MGIDMDLATAEADLHRSGIHGHVCALALTSNAKLCSIGANRRVTREHREWPVIITRGDGELRSAVLEQCGRLACLLIHDDGAVCVERHVRLAERDARW